MKWKQLSEYLPIILFCGLVLFVIILGVSSIVMNVSDNMYCDKKGFEGAEFNKLDSPDVICYNTDFNEREGTVRRYTYFRRSD